MEDAVAKDHYIRTISSIWISRREGGFSAWKLVVREEDPQDSCAVAQLTKGLKSCEANLDLNLSIRSRVNES